MLAQDMERQNLTGMESCGNGILEMGSLFPSPAVMLVPLGSSASQPCVLSLWEAWGNSHGVSKLVLRYHIAEQFICNSCEFISQRNKIILDLSDSPEAILNN